MPTPPKESIRGTKSFEIAAFEFAKNQYSYITELETFTESEDFTKLSEEDQLVIQKEVELQNNAYEVLLLRVDNY